MKKMRNKLQILLIVTAILIPVLSSAQDVPPPPPPGHGTTGNQEGGRGPVGSGLILLLGLGSAYGGWKGYRVYQHKKKKFTD